jgi:hypothetical protein
MRSLILAVVVAAALAGTALVPTSAYGGNFDGKRPLLCTAFRLFECDLSDGCLPATAAELGVAGSWTMDFKKKQVTGTAPGSLPNTIGQVELLDGKLFLSGIQDGLPNERDGVAWSVSINDPDGVMTLMAAGEGVGIVGLGSCVPK